MFGVEVHCLNATLYQAKLVFSIVDDKLGSDPYVFTVVTKDTDTDSVKGSQC